MRWVLAGIAFALLVALAIGTAAIRAESTHRRAYLQMLGDRFADLRMAQEHELILWREATTPQRLVAYWLTLEEVRYQ